MTTTVFEYGLLLLGGGALSKLIVIGHIEMVAWLCISLAWYDVNLTLCLPAGCLPSALYLRLKTRMLSVERYKFCAMNW